MEMSHGKRFLCLFDIIWITRCMIRIKKVVLCVTVYNLSGHTYSRPIISGRRTPSAFSKQPLKPTTTRLLIFAHLHIFQDFIFLQRWLFTRQCGCGVNSLWRNIPWWKMFYKSNLLVKKYCYRKTLPGALQSSQSHICDYNVELWCGIPLLNGPLWALELCLPKITAQNFKLDRFSEHLRAQQRRIQKLWMENHNHLKENKEVQNKITNNNNWQTKSTFEVTGALHPSWQLCFAEVPRAALSKSLLPTKLTWSTSNPNLPTVYGQTESLSQSAENKETR